jgi:hypothetical protein
MKKLKIVGALLAVAIFLAGCVVSSVYPFYTAKDLIFEPSLLGRWNPINPESNLEETNEYIQFRRLGKSSYFMGMKMSGDETNWFEAHLFETKGQQFIDHRAPVTNQCFGFGLLAEHYICKVINNTNTIRLAWLKQEWMDELLKKDAKAIRHMVVFDEPDDSKGRVVLTAETEELQKFILKYVTDTNAFFEVKYQKAKE